jgi:hypothetical protein
MTSNESPDGLDAPLSEGLADYPLRTEPASEFLAPAPPVARSADGTPVFAAPLSDRWTAAAGDTAMVGLVTALALLGASFFAGRPLPLSGLPWAVAFGVYLSFFAIVPPLVVFGRTVGMTIAGLGVRVGPAGRRLTAAEAVRRWIGSVATGATAGLALLATRRDPEAPTLADRFSGRPLVRDEA